MASSLYKELEANPATAHSAGKPGARDKSQGCVHHWLVDKNDVGVCRLCGENRDFGKLFKSLRRSGSGRYYLSRPGVEK